MDLKASSQQNFTSSSTHFRIKVVGKRYFHQELMLSYHLPFNNPSKIISILLKSILKQEFSAENNNFKKLNQTGLIKLIAQIKRLDDKSSWDKHVKQLLQNGITELG